MANIISKYIENRKMIKMIKEDLLQFEKMLQDREYDIAHNKKVLDVYIENKYFNFYRIKQLLDAGVDINQIATYPKCVDLITDEFIRIINEGDVFSYNNRANIFDNIIKEENIDNIISRLNINGEVFDSNILKEWKYHEVDKIIDIARKSGYIPFQNGIDINILFDGDSKVKQERFLKLGLINAEIYNQIYKYKLNKYLEWINNGLVGPAPSIDIIDAEFDNIDDPAKYWINQSKMLGMDAIDVVMKYIANNMQIDDINGLFDSNYILTDKFFKTDKVGYPLRVTSGNTENFNYSSKKSLEMLYFLCNNVGKYDGAYRKFFDLLNQYKEGKNELDIKIFLAFLDFSSENQRIDENGLKEDVYKDALYSLDGLNVIRELDPNYLEHYTIKELQYIKLLDRYDSFLRDVLIENCIDYNISIDSFISKYVAENGLNKEFFDIAKFKWLFIHPDLFNSIDDYEKFFTSAELQYIKYSQAHKEFIKEKIYNDIDSYFDEKGFKDSSIKVLFDNYDWNLIIELMNDLKKDISLITTLGEKEKTIINYYMDITDVELQKYYMDYLKEHINDITIDKIHLVADVLERIMKTNSEELLSMKSSFATLVLETDNPIENIEKIEKIFIKNNLPIFGKIYSCFEILYPNFEKKTGNQYIFNFDNNSRMAPQLKDQTLPRVGFHNGKTETRFNVIYNDLLRIALRSNSKDLRDYLRNIEYGNELFLGIINNTIDINNLKAEEKHILEIFANHLEVLLEKVITDENKIILDNASLEDRIKVFGSLFKPNSRYDLKDRIVRTFCHFAGINSFEELVSIMDNAVKEADNRGRLYEQELNNQAFSFEPGDFVRCIGNYQAFGSTLANGNFSKEFLSVFTGKSDSDTTPLDIDFTRIDSKRNSLYESIADTPTGFGFGNIFVIIKMDNPNLNITRDSFGNLTNKEYDPSKIEMFGTSVGGVGYETHWGARTGMAFTDIDYLLYKEDRNINKNEPYDSNGNVNYEKTDKEVVDDLSKIKFEIAKNGYYIPIIDFSGKLIFTSKEFENIRKQMNGLSYYDNNSYEFSENLDIQGIDEISSEIELSIKDSNTKRAKINNIVDGVFNEFNLVRKDVIDGDLTPGSVEFIDTGSTGRFTNVPFEADFDFLLRVDQSLVSDKEKYKEFKNNLLNTFKKYPIDKIGTTNHGDYRLKGVQIDSDTKIDIDLSFAVKTNKTTYSSDECVKDRLNTIYNQDSEKYKSVVANIILAKKLLKQAGVYKPFRSDKNQGGLGGIGIENWILQNGGSIVDAIKSFLNNSEGKSFEEFKKSYQLWDFGINHFAVREGEYPYDNFINNMNKDGYEKMKAALKEYLKLMTEEKMSVK